MSTGKVRASAGTAASPIKLSAGTTERVFKRRSATAPREGVNRDVPTQTLSTTTTLPPPPPHYSDVVGGGLSSTSRGYARVVSWQALPIFYAKVGHLDIRTYMGSAMGRTKLEPIPEKFINLKNAYLIYVLLIIDLTFGMFSAMVVCTKTPPNEGTDRWVQGSISANSPANRV